MNGGTSLLPFPRTWFAFYLDGVLEETINNNGELVSKLGTLRTPVSTPVDLGDHGNGRGPFNGALDEVRFESVARSANWLKLCYENQKPLQSLVGPLVQDGEEFSVSKSNLDMKEGESISLSAKPGGARKVYWVLKDDKRGDSRCRPIQLYLQLRTCSERQTGHIAFQGSLRIRCENSNHPNHDPRERSRSFLCAGGTQKMEWQR